MANSTTSVKKRAAQVVMGSAPDCVSRAVRCLWNRHSDQSACHLTYTSQVFVLASEVFDKQSWENEQGKMKPSGELPIALYVGNMLDADKATFTVLTYGIGGFHGSEARYTRHVGIQEAQDYIIKWAARRFSVTR